MNKKWGQMEWMPTRRETHVEKYDYTEQRGEGGGGGGGVVPVVICLATNICVSQMRSSLMFSNTLADR
jgi:hypothetical protein